MVCYYYYYYYFDDTEQSSTAFIRVGGGDKKPTVKTVGSFLPQLPTLPANRVLRASLWTLGPPQAMEPSRDEIPRPHKEERTGQQMDG